MKNSLKLYLLLSHAHSIRNLNTYKFLYYKKGLISLSSDYPASAFLINLPMLPKISCVGPLSGTPPPKPSPLAILML